MATAHSQHSISRVELPWLAFVWVAVKQRWKLFKMLAPLLNYAFIKSICIGNNLHNIRNKHLITCKVGLLPY